MLLKLKNNLGKENNSINASSSSSGRLVGLFFFKKIIILNFNYLIGSKCPFCTEYLPYPLPLKIRLLLNKIGNQNGKIFIFEQLFRYVSQYHVELIFRFILGKPTQEDRSLFCEIHYAETNIVPNGIQKGYPMEINFELLETRIIQIKDVL